MIFSRFRKRPDQSSVYAAYAAIVAQSRQDIFYDGWQVPDSVTGRFDMICVHLCLVFRCLKTGDSSHRVFAQDLFDLFFKDMDRSLREMGVGDMGVPKRVQKMAELFYGLLDKLNAALDKDGDTDLAEVLKRNVYASEDVPALAKMCAYVRAADSQLQSTPPATILDGKLDLKPAL